MTCNKCGEKPKKTCGAFPKAVIEIDNPEKIVLLRKVMVPASMGDESTFPPTIGKYHNVLLEYEASGSVYLYSSDGIPTKLSSDVTELQAQLNALRVRIGEEEVARADADTALSDRITSLDDSLATVARTGSYNDLSDKPTIGNGTLTIKKNGSNVGTFTANATTNKAIDISVPTRTSDLTNDGSDGTSTYIEADELSTVATSGSYNDLTNKPTIGNATLTIKRNGTNVGTFTANATTNKSIDIAVPTKTSDLTNDGADGTSTYVESDDLPTVDTTYSSSSNNAIANSTVTNSLDRNVMTDLAVDSTPSTTTVNLNNTKTNLAYPSSSTTSSISLPVASSTQAGVMNSATFDAVTNNTNNINAILNGAVAISNLPESPTQAQLTTAWENETGLTSLINRASVYDVTNNKVWTYYTNDQTWHAASNTSQVTVNTFTNSSEGTIKGSTNDGQVFAESDGTGSVNGWDTLTGNVANNTSKLATIEQGAEVNVQANWTQTNANADDYIKNKPANLVQDANYVHTDNNFTTTLKNKLDGIESGAEVNVQADWSQTDTTADDYIKNKPTIPTVNNATLTIQKNGVNVQTFTANSSTNKTANITVPTAVSELTNDSGYATTTQLNNGLATKQDTLTAGNNIQINGNTISATDTTYTAGNAIDITNGEISADIHPADFFTAEDTVSDCGSDLSLDDTMASTLRSVELKGDTYQQTYSGFQLLQKQGLATPTTDTDFWYVVTDQTITALEDGWARFTSSSSSSSKNFFLNRLGAFSWEVSTTYTVICEIKNAPSAGRLTISQPQNASDPFASVSVGVQADYLFNGTDHTFVFSGTTKASHVSMGLRPFFNAAFASGSSVDLRLTIVAGDHTADYQNYIGDNWEPYVGGIPAPNPDYPQAVQVVAGEQTVKVYRKNLVDFANASPTVVNNGSGVNNNGVYTINANTTDKWGGIRIIAQVEGNTTYTFSATVTSTTATDGSILFIPRYSSATGLQIESNKAKSGERAVVTFTTPSGLTEADIRFLPFEANATATYTDIMLEEGSTATTYEPYQSQSYEINLGKNLLELANYAAGGVTTTLNSDGKITVSGTTANNYANFMTYQTPLSSPSGTYTFSRTGDNTYRVSLTLFSEDKSQNTSINIAAGSNSATATIPFEIGYVAGAYTNLTVGSELNFTTGLQLEFGSTATSYAPYFTPIELCKIGDYQDYIYKSGDDWYVHKETGKVVFDGTESSWNRGGVSESGSYRFFVTVNGIKTTTVVTELGLVMSNKLLEVENQAQYDGLQGIRVRSNGEEQLALYIYETKTMTTADFRDWLGTNNIIAYYALATPTDTQITNTALVAQLNALAEAKSYNDQTNILVTAAGDNLPATLCVEAYRKSLSGVIEAIDNACTCGERATHLVLSNPTTATWSGTGSIAIPYSDGSAVSMGTFVSTDVVFTKDDGTTMTVGDLYTALTNGKSFEIDLPFGEINSACSRDSAAIVATVENAKLDGSSKQTLDQTSQGRLSEMYTSSVPVAVHLSSPWGGVLLDERFGVEHLMTDDGDTMTSSYRFVVNTYETFQPPR